MRLTFCVSIAAWAALCAWAGAGPAGNAGGPAASEPDESALPEGAIARLGSTELRHAAQVAAVAVSPDGRRIASVGQDGSLCIWDAASGRKLASRKTDQSPVAVSFVDDGNTVAWILPQGEVRVADFAGAGAERGFATTQGAQRARFSADGRVVASGGGGGAGLWRVADGNDLGSVEVSGNPIGLAVSADGNSLAVTHWDNKPGAAGFVHQVWDAAAGKVIWSSKERVGTITAPQGFSPDGRLLAAASSAGDIVLLDARTGEKHASFAAGGPVRGTQTQCLTFLPDGNRIAGVTQEAVCVWDANGGAILARIDMPFGGCMGLAAAPDGSFLATAGPGQMVGLWDIRTGKARFGLRGHVGGVLCVALGGDGLVSAGLDGTVHRWNLADGNDEIVLALKDRQSRWLAVSPDGALAVSRTWGNLPGAVVWDLRKGASIRNMQTEGVAYAAAVSHDGQLVATLDPRSICLWHVPSGRLLRQIDIGAVRYANCGLAFSPDGKILALSWPAVRLFEVASGQEAAELAGAGFSSSPSSLAFSPDGRRLAAVVPGAISVLDPATEGQESLDPGGEASAQSVAFSPDGRWIATGCADGSILIWHAPRPKPPADTRPAEANELAELWADLADKDARRAYKASLRLQSEGAAAVAMLRGRLKPSGAAAQPAEMARLLADLDSDSLRVREEASRRLAAVADAGFLRDALAKAGSDEVRARLAELLADLADPTIKDGELLRASRAVRVLELIGDEAARELLSRLASGGPGRITRDAAAAIARLKPPATMPASAPRP